MPNQALLNKFAQLSPFGERCDTAEIFNLFCRVARLSYEGRPCKGVILMVSELDYQPDDLIFLSAPLNEFSAYGLRKLLEISSYDTPLWFDGECVIGYGTTPAIRQNARVVFHDDARWTVDIGGVAELSVPQGEPETELPVLLKDSFFEHLRGLFPKIAPDQLQRIWGIAQAAIGQSCGINILFSPRAHEESRRLAAQCIPVDPRPLTPELVRELAKIDGTTLSDINGQVHALSAILDGDHSPKGSWERGGRYNSAVNYVLNQDVPSMILTVSQDGGIEVLPPIDRSKEPWIQKRYGKLNSTVT